LSGSVDLFLNVCSGAFQFPSFLLAGAYYFFSQVISCAGDSLLVMPASTRPSFGFYLLLLET
jgi:hypothetical protein